MNIGLRYFFANDKEGREMEKNRFYVFSKNMPKLENETDEKYHKRIVDATMNSARNEVIVALRDVKIMNETEKTNQKYYYGTNKNNDNAMKTMDFYVPDLTKYAGMTQEAKAKDALFSKEGIKQMFPMMNFFGKNAFAEGVRVYCAKDMKHYNIGDFEKIQKRMQKKTSSSKKKDYVKLTDDLSNSKYLAKQQKILEYQSVFTQEYLAFVRHKNLDIDIQKELDQNKSLFENLPRYDSALVTEALKIQKNVNSSQLFGTPTAAPTVNSRENSQAFQAELLSRLNSAKLTLGLLGRLNSANIPLDNSRPPSSTTPAGFTSKVKSLIKFPQSSNNSREQSGQVSVVSSNGQRPPSSVTKLPPITQPRNNSGEQSGQVSGVFAKQANQSSATTLPLIKTRKKPGNNSEVSPQSNEKQLPSI